MALPILQILTETATKLVQTDAENAAKQFDQMLNDTFRNTGFSLIWLDAISMDRKLFGRNGRYWLEAFDFPRVGEYVLDEEGNARRVLWRGLVTLDME